MAVLHQPDLFDINKFMIKQLKNDIKKSRGRPATGQGSPILVRLQPDLLALVDANCKDNETRPEAIRRILKEYLE